MRNYRLMQGLRLRLTLRRGLPSHMSVIVCALVTMAFIIVVVQPGSAATITVNETVDELNTDGDCSLREALYAANNDTSQDTCLAGSGADTIVIPAGTYSLSMGGTDSTGLVGDLDITADVTLVGAGTGLTIIDGSDPLFFDKLFEVHVADVQMQNLRITGAITGANKGSAIYVNLDGSLMLSQCEVDNNYNGALAGAIWNDGSLTIEACTFASNVSGNSAGAIYNAGVATITGSTFEFNQATNVPGVGGAIRNIGEILVTTTTFSDNTADGNGGAIYATNDPLTIVDSLFLSNDSASDGGAVYVAGSQSVITNSTFTGNTAASRGGALYFANQASMHNLTIFENTADFDADEFGDGGGIFNNVSNVSIANSIIAGNSDDSPTTAHPDCSGTLVSAGYNLLGENNGCSGLTDGTNGDQVGPSGSPIDPLLQPLADNGGPTQTLGLLFNSPAVEAGNPTGCRDQDAALLDTDQRGYVRPWGSVCDIGAYEYNSPGIPNEPSALLLNLFRSPASITKGSAASGPNQWFARVALGDHTGDPGLAFHYVVWLHVPEDWTLPWATQYSFTGDFANGTLSPDWTAQPWVQDTANCALGGAADAGFKWRAFRGPLEALPPLVDRLNNQVNLRGGLGVPGGETSDLYGGVRVVLGTYYDFDTDGTPERYQCDNIGVTSITVTD